MLLKPKDKVRRDWRGLMGRRHFLSTNLFKQIYPEKGTRVGEKLQKA